MIEYTVNVCDDGSKYWYLDGEFHREDGPAIEYADGTKKWYLDGEPHREDGPAVVHVDGSKEWWLNGKRHREDGPAVEWVGGTEWWLNDEQLTKKEFDKRQNSCNNKVVEIDGRKYKLTPVD